MRQRGFWRETIHTALQSLGGQAYLTDVYEWVRNNVALSEKEKSPSPHQGRPYYVNTVRGIASDMTNQGLLIRVANGYYRLPNHLSRINRGGRT